MQELRNIAIIAHVDHGKTTLVDKILYHCSLFRENEGKKELILDNNDQERERGITILSKNVSVEYKGIKINVIDTGIGMPEDRLEQVFSSFTQVNGDSKKRGAGTGLGLAITKHLIEKMNGSITVTSRLGEGSNFEIILPYIIANDEQIKSITEAQAKHVQHSDNAQTKIKTSAYILVVEDIQTNQ